MKLNKYFMLGLAGLAFAACSNDEGDALSTGKKQISVTITTGNSGTRAVDAWTDEPAEDETIMEVTGVKVYLLSGDNIVAVEEAVVGTNIWHEMSTSIDKIAAVANYSEETELPTTGTWTAVQNTVLNMKNYLTAKAVPLVSEVGELSPTTTDEVDGNTMWEGEVTLATKLSRIELSGNLQCTNLGENAYNSLTLAHVGLNGVFPAFTLGGATSGTKASDESNQLGYPTAVPEPFYDAATPAVTLSTTVAAALGATYGYNVLGKPDEILLQFNTVYKDPVADGWVVYNPAYLKITDLIDADGQSVSFAGGEIYQITNLIFTEQDLTDLDPGEPTICVTAKVALKDWKIVGVTPVYGQDAL